MKKILFGITSLTFGGAERVLIDLANELSKNYDITIWTLYGNGELEKQLNKKVKLKSYVNSSYNKMSKIQKRIMPLKILLFKKDIYKKCIKEDYDVEIAFLEGPITRILSTKNKETKKIAWVHNDIAKVFGDGIKSRLKRKIDKKIYSKYEKIIFVSNDNKEKFEKVYNIKNEKEVIYNYLNTEAVIKKANETIDIKLDENQINIVTVSRLVKQKAIDRFINIHSKLVKEGLNHKVYVIGDGPEKSKLEQKIIEKGVKESFILLGKKENPYPYIKKADYFALLSYYEGYPMVLLEAQVLGKYIVITDTAARETLQDYNNCMIVKNDEESIYQELRKLIQKKEILKKVQQEEYSNQNIINQIKKVIED